MMNCLCVYLYFLILIFSISKKKYGSKLLFHQLDMKLARVFSIASHLHCRLALMINSIALFLMILTFLLHCIAAAFMNVIFSHHWLVSANSYLNVLTVFSKCVDQVTMKRTKGYLWTLM